VNPVLRGDLRARVSSPKALTVYTIFLGLLAVLVVLSLPPVAGRIEEVRGEGLLGTILIVESVLVAYFTSATGSGEIALEGDKSVEDLVTSPFSARVIAVGKVSSALSFAALLVLVAVPIVLIMAGIRGEPLEGIARAGVLTILFGGAAGALGAWYGAIFESDFIRSFVHWLTLLVWIVVASAFPPPLNVISPVYAVAAVERDGLQPASMLAAVGYALVAAWVIWAIRARVEMMRRDVLAS